MDWFPLWMSLKTALLATLITFVTGVITARLVYPLKHAKGLIDGILSLPLVLPPTVVGFFLLIIFGTHSPVGRALETVGARVVFTTGGAVIAAVVVSFPVMYRTVRGAFEQVDQNLVFAGRTLGLGEVKIFTRILLPEAKSGVAAGVMLAFARALGEFGATIMIAGNIPQKTQTMSVAVYSAMQGGNRDLAFFWVLIIMAISFVTIILMNVIADKTGKGDRA